MGRGGALLEADLLESLPVGNLGLPLHILARVSSTNDYAKQLADGGADHGTLVVAEVQTAGRGRLDRSWKSSPGASLAFSLVLRPGPLPPEKVTRLTALGALAVSEAARKEGGEIRIKWPNDLLMGGKKFGGILTELSWERGGLEYAVLGIGINVGRESVPDDAALDFPATCLEAELERRIDRQRLLLDVLAGLDRWLGELGTDEFMRSWESQLAYVGQHIHVVMRKGAFVGILLGLDPDGRMKLEVEDGSLMAVGEDVIQVRPVDRDDGWSKLASD
jgi:BirA family biotin operon repressor/biotin-[acetyl-CoA-carboxylase] ligase